MKIQQETNEISEYCETKNNAGNLRKWDESCKNTVKNKINVRKIRQTKLWNWYCDKNSENSKMKICRWKLGK